MIKYVKLREELEAPIGAYCTVVSATSKAINVSADITLKSGADGATVFAEIESAIEKYIKSTVFVWRICKFDYAQTY